MALLIIGRILGLNWFISKEFHQFVHISLNFNMIIVLISSTVFGVRYFCLFPMRKTHGTYNFYIDIIRTNEKENKNDLRHHHRKEFWWLSPFSCIVYFWLCSIEFTVKSIGIGALRAQQPTNDVCVLKKNAFDALYISTAVKNISSMACKRIRTNNQQPINLCTTNKKQWRHSQKIHSCKIVFLLWLYLFLLDFAAAMLVFLTIFVFCFFHSLVFVRICLVYDPSVVFFLHKHISILATSVFILE